MAKTLRRTGRRTRPVGARRFGKKRQTALSVYATKGQYSRVPRSYFSGFPNQFNITLKANYFERTTLSTATYERYFPIHGPFIKTGATFNAVAGGFFPLLSIYQRCTLLTCKVRMRIVPEQYPQSQTDIETGTMRFCSNVWTQSQAVDASTTGIVNFDEYRTSQGSHYYDALPYPQTPAVIDDTQSVDIIKFIGGQRLDHVQSTYFSQGATTWVARTPNNANTLNMPAYAFAIARSTAANLNVRIMVEMEFGCEFTNVRPLEQLPAALEPWTIS